MLRCPEILTLDYEWWRSYRKKDVRLSVLCLWLSVAFGFCLGLDGRICIYRDWPLVALNPLPSYAVYLYDECFVSRVEVNTSCRLVFSSD